VVVHFGCNTKKSPSFRRKFELYYGFGTGNAFIGEQMDNCIRGHDEYNPEADHGYQF